MIFKHLIEKVSNTYTYILCDEETKEAIIIDSVIEMVDRDVQVLKEFGLKLKYIIGMYSYRISSNFIDTHVRL